VSQAWILGLTDSLELIWQLVFLANSVTSRKGTSNVCDHNSGNGEWLVDFPNLPRAFPKAASRRRLHENRGWLVNCDICLGPLERPHHLAAITTAETGCGWSIVISASGLSNGRILCLRSRRRLHGNGR
jgi:hypothetical protein